MKQSNPVKAILIAAIFAIVAFAAVAFLPANENEACVNNTDQITECKRSESLPDIELMRTAAARAKDIFSIVSQPILR